MKGPRAIFFAGRPAFLLRLGVAAAIAACAAAAGAGRARADWLMPDPTYRDAQFQLRSAVKDTVGHSDDPGRLDTLAVALLRLARTDDAAKLFRRVLAMRPGDDAAEAGLGKLALFAGRTAEAESLLAGAADDPEAQADLFAARLRRGEWTGAAKLAEDVNETGRVPLLEKLAEVEPFKISGAPQAKLIWANAYPVPLIRVRLNGQSVLFGIDTGASDLILDPMWVARANVTRIPGQSLTFWCGARLAVDNALVQRLDLGGVRIENVPAGVFSLHKWSIETNKHGEVVAGVLGLNVLRRFTPTIDYKKHVLELQPLTTAAAAVTPPGAMRVPFELWGESELMVRGTVGGSRKLAMVVQTGIPGCGFAAPSEMFDELGIKAGTVSRLVQGVGSWVQGRPWVGVTVSGVSVGPYGRNRVPGWSNAMDSSELWRHGVRRDAILSGDFFEDARLTFDWPKQELVIERKP